MIQLAFAKHHRSIVELPRASLPDFTVITGVNGSGKSHLLEAIENRSITVAGTANPGEIRRFDWNSLVPKTENPVDPNFLTRNRSAFIQNTVNISSDLKRDAKAAVDRLAAQLKITGFPLEHDKHYLELDQLSFAKIAGDDLARYWPQIEQALKQATEIPLNRRMALNTPEAAFLRYLSQVCQKRRVRLLGLNAEEIDQLIPIDWSPVDLFQHNISELFAAYHRAWEENRQHGYYNREYNENYKVYTWDEFRRHFGDPPWELFNKVLTEAALDFQATYPKGRADLVFQAKLKSKTTGAEIPFSDLSSGEKVIASFALCAYRVQREIVQIDTYPKVLLFDEIDAPLHPSMAKGLISAIDKILVRERGVKVMLTTHSPATVSFAPDGSLFRLEKSPRQLIPCNKEEAIQLLTSGYFSVTDNSRFVITEAQRDRVFYTAIYEKLVERKIIKIYPNLVFIPAETKSDKESGGREKVKQWSQKLSAAGLNQIFGLIDRDDGNQATGNIKVIRRYSIENYFLDPINVYAALINARKHNALLDIGIVDLDYRRLKETPDEQLQKVADAIRNAIEASSAPLAQASTPDFEVEYICGKRIRLPWWMRERRGHDLVAIHRDCFKQMVGSDFILTKDDCGELISMLTERLPDFIPVELVDTLNELFPQ